MKGKKSARKLIKKGCHIWILSLFFICGSIAVTACDMQWVLSMKKYIIKRMVISVITVWLIATCSFFLVHALPGNPIAVNSGKILSQETMERMIAYYGLDKPLWQQYLTFMNNLLHGDFGYSYKYPGQSVNGMISSTFPVSAQLGMQAYIISIPLGFLFGIIAARKRGKAVDYLLVGFSAMGVSVPVFIIAALLQMVFAIQLKWLPVSLWKSFSYTILPTLTLALGSIAGRTRGMRTLMLEIINEDYIKTAKAKGLSNFMIVLKHQIRNAIIPMIPMMGLELVGMLMGSFVVEQIYAIPGIGSYFVTSIQSLDYTMVLGLTVFFGIFVVVANFIVDIIYGFVDPRIRVTK
jgi:oligopeptide transport system permease protein